ncbi:MAG: 4-(cytidine 5'-diphospho)-2-C-methyl-D-erythritol kinase [Dongiaceae bacterium]
MPPAAVRAVARAKINLYLHVVGRRADGYHLLDSLVVFADLGDRLAAAPADRLGLAVEGPFAAGLGAGPDNLVLRAAEALKAALGRPELGAALTLTKNLPVASGIGGGSADGAATLPLLLRLWGASLPADALARLALPLGADLPVCLAGGPRFMGGVGETMDPVPPLPPAWLVLANPGLPLPTPAVFRARQGPFSPPGRWSAPLPDAAALAAALAARGNDRAAPARSLAPAIDRVLAALAATPGCLLARLSGSGATCFGLYAAAAAAEQAAAALRRAEPGWWVAAAPMLTEDRSPLE